MSPDEEENSMAHGFLTTQEKRPIHRKKVKTTQETTTDTYVKSDQATNSTNEASSESSPSNGTGFTGAPDMGIKNIMMENSHSVQTVEIKKRPGQSLGFYIREGNGMDRSGGVFISRIQTGTVADSNGLLHIGDEILTINKKDVSNMSLDDVVILMSIPKKLTLKIRTRKCHKKNNSCPSLAVTEQETKPIVNVFQKVRSSSETALEETEKAANLVDPFTQEHEHQQSRRRHDRPTSSQYASIFISPHKAEAKLLSDEADSENSSDGSLPRSIDSNSKHYYVGYRGYASDSAYDQASAYFSPNLSPNQHGSASDQEYLKYMYSDGGLPRKLIPKSPSKSVNKSGLNINSDSEIYVGGQLPSYYDVTSKTLESARKFQGGLKDMIHVKGKYGKSQRSRSPEYYNSDSELVFTNPQKGQTDMRGFASDYETYAGGGSDDDPIYCVPKLPFSHSGSSELEELLRKFNTLSMELQQEKNKLQRQVSGKDVTDFTVPSPRNVDYSSDEYAYIGSSRILGGKPSSPISIQKAASTQTPGQMKMTRNRSADSAQRSRTYHSDMGKQELSTSYQESKYVPPSIHTMSRVGIPSSASTSSASDRTKFIDTDGQHISRSTSRFKDLQLSRKPLQIPYSEFEFYRPDLRRRLELSKKTGQDGILSIHILSGQGLKSTKMTLRDLYCVVSIDSVNKARTMIRTGAVNFDWDEAFDVELEDSKEVSFLIYNWDPNFKHRLCFHGTVLLPSILENGKKKCIALKMEPKGLLYTTLLYHEPSVSLQRLPSMRKNGVFGKDLETVTKQEGQNVPMVIRKCIEEVEKRGLDVVGIYRLCASARRKAQLREAFEKNAQAVDLSPENVSDIHVVTGVLKDYLRELPEPLFTNALYQMLLDALSVRLPSDPDGSAKLMLSILECLPKANQETMAVVLNHLKKVAGNADKNKMNIVNLAICFGPVLLCPSPVSSGGTSLDFKKHIEVLKYLLEIWPVNYEMVKVSSQSSIKKHCS
ncbi:SYDE [Mytilus coruscus]|uniref:SYDE n=1 Tax=Mytilus coruscus TaxID=42192 RepID=A0A6J8AQR3_MYTCO|nr:SYDE [Mytilus coruscus]